MEEEGAGPRSHAILPTITLDRAMLDRLYPFHVQVDGALRIVGIGRALTRLLGDATLGRSFDEAFKFDRPFAVNDFATLAGLERQTLLISSVARPGLVLKGEAVVIDGHAQAVLLLVPWIRDLAIWDELRLTASDFAVGDSTPDLLFLIDTQAALLKDAKGLNERLQLAANAARAASEAKTQFLANMSHELRTPLNAIIGFSEYMMVLGAQQLPPRFLEYARDIHSSGRFLLDLVTDLLDLSRIEANKLAVDDNEFDAAPVLDELVRAHEPMAQQIGITIRHSTSGADVRLRADERLLRQILINLITNAIKFNRSGGTVELCMAGCPGWGIEFVVADSGQGVEPELIPLLFEPFRQKDSRVARPFGGTGLGLAIVKRLTELLDGAIHMTSAPGIGTTVRVRLPANRVLRSSLTST